MVGWRSFPVLVSVYFQGEISVWVRVLHFDLYKVFEFQVTRNVLSLVFLWPENLGQTLDGGWKRTLVGHFPVWRIWISFKKDLFWYCNVKSFNISTSSQYVCVWIWRVNSSFGCFKQIGTSLGGDILLHVGVSNMSTGPMESNVFVPLVGCEG